MSASQILQTPNALSSSLPLPLLLLLLLLPAFLPLISQHPSAAAVTSTSTSFYHNDIKLDFLCRGISGHLSVRDVPWDCASFLVCYRGRAFLHQCPGDRLYNHTDTQRQCLPETEVDASRCRGKLLDYINDICRENPSARIPSAINCAHYVDCESRQKTATGPANKAPAGSLDGLLECSYPKLFSPDTGSCQHHSLVSCGHRFEPTAPCQYLQYLQLYDCHSLNCTQCASHHPSCLSLPDGLHPLPGHQGVAMKCQDERTVEFLTCPAGYNASCQ
ncbi:hypothetical protein ACOMHN_021433 [Nucella lapillus]